jgi:hypothetical protein
MFETPGQAMKRAHNTILEQSDLLRLLETKLKEASAWLDHGIKTGNKSRSHQIIDTAIAEIEAYKNK